ncbi:unnamed protein product [Somion occarium]|uniref:Uncharacterized protein n=1 Tax=Somion occarium TaxID=3059160 RepID=A0ABP1DZS4_9APHY
MKPRSLLQPIFRRYASRLPERPPYRAPDPLLNNPHATYQQVSEDMTFIHRPPPTAPSPISYTTNPASPLLRDASGVATLPPTVRPEKAQPPRMSDEDLAKLRQLRMEDPDKWSTGRLAKEFNCTPAFVMRVAALKVADRKRLKKKRDEEHEENRGKWGDKKALNHEVRQQRKLYW